MRKGAATYCSSGTTACPSSTAIHLRAGWTLGGVQDTYMRYESAGDMHVGRTVCGLPCDSHEFAILPPSFNQVDEEVKAAIALCFPRLPVNLHLVAEFALASVVYHHDYIIRVVPTNHPILSTVLFREPSFLATLSAKVHCHLHDATNEMKATGVPPHVSILKDIKVLSEKIDASIVQQQSCVADVVAGVVEELEQRSLGGSTLTRRCIEESMRKCLEDAGVVGVNTELTQSQVTQPTNTVRWRLQSIPSNFQFSNGGTAEAWQTWCCGDPARGYPPLRGLSPIDLPNQNMRKRLSDLKYLMHAIEDKARELGIFRLNPTIEDAISIYEQSKSVVQVDRESTQSRKRRRSQLTWQSVVSLLRTKRRRSNGDR
jgi:hypothetical protein